MNVQLIDEVMLFTSSAPGKYFGSAVVCFEDSCYLVPKTVATTFHIDNHPVAGYGFGDDSVEEGLAKIIASHTNEDELKARLLELVGGNTTLVVNFSDYKKTRIKGFLGSKTFSARQNAMSYISFTVGKKESKKLVEFYPNF